MNSTVMRYLVFQRRPVEGPSAASRRKVPKEGGGNVSQGRIMQASETLHFTAGRLVV